MSFRLKLAFSNWIFQRVFDFILVKWMLNDSTITLHFECQRLVFMQKIYFKNRSPGDVFNLKKQSNQIFLFDKVIVVFIKGLLMKVIKLLKLLHPSLKDYFRMIRRSLYKLRLHLS